jgi:Pyruvate/2-oxoacid:ferredoxin oxidoreductase gamma subunit
LIHWCKCEAAKVGFTIVIDKSDNNSDRRKKNRNKLRKRHRIQRTEKKIKERRHGNEKMYVSVQAVGLLFGLSGMKSNAMFG